jgi:mono/diheme cytochrome c family protein
MILENFSPLFSDLCGLCVFARDNSSFRLRLCRAVFEGVLVQRIRANLAILLLCAPLVIGACSRDSDNSSGAAKDPDWQRGRAIHLANCGACHNLDPSKDGPIGPALKGSSRELIEYRVLRTEYPPGYKPKRDTKLMPTFPYLKSEIPYLVAYLR